MIRLLAVDMDGTCLDRRSRLTDKTLRALKKAADAGILVIPATGRALTCLPHKLAGRTDIYRYVISSNGARLTDCNTWNSLSEAMIPKEDALSLLKQVRKEKLGVTSHIRYQYLLQGRNLVAMGRLIYGKDAGGVYHVKNMVETVEKTHYGVEELQFYFLAPSSRERIRQILEGYPSLQAAYTKIYVEVFSKKASKGKALADLQDILGISQEETACIGDGENDLSLFEVSGLRMAVGNAVPELKEHADIVLPGNQKDGAAIGIEKILQMRQGGTR